jgi:hypothetical protein
MDEQTALEGARYWGKIGAEARRRVDGACVVCGAAFNGTIKRIYCSNRCRQRAKNQRGQKAQANMVGSTWNESSSTAATAPVPIHL